MHKITQPPGVPPDVTFGLKETRTRACSRQGSATGCRARDRSLLQADQVRLLHIADVHLDTPFAGRSAAMRQRLRRATLEALDRCVATALEEEVDALLIVGDLFDRAHLSFETERFLLARLRRLARYGIQVVYATGNHDPAEKTRARHLDWPETVTVIADASPVVVSITDRAGETVGFVTGAGHATAREAGDLSAALRPVPDTDLPQTALLHTQVLPAGAGGSHHAYAPSSLETLRAAGFHYWALGHVHLRQELSTDPPVHYCGSLQGRNRGETGAKGGLLVDLDDPAHPVVEFREFAPVRWEKLGVSGLEEARTLDDVAGAVTRAWAAAREADPGAGDTEWVLSVELEGPSPMWRQLRGQADLDTVADEVGQRLRIVGAEIRAARLHPGVRVEDHLERRDVLGATLQLARNVVAGGETLGLSEGDLAGFEPERDGTLAAYLRRLLEGGGEEIMARMLDPEELSE